MSGTRAVNVVMTVFNGERYLAKAIESILSQTFTDFDLIVVDDLSSDNTAAILDAYAARDNRVRILRNERNLGPYPSANRALETANAPFIARMDADDISEPERLIHQLNFLDKHPDYLLTATSYRAIDQDDDTLYTKRKAADHEHLRFLLPFRMPLEHPSIMFRARLPTGVPVRYDTSRPIAQDYALAAKLANNGKIAILPSVLFNYRIHKNNITATRRAEQARVKYEIARTEQASHWSDERIAALDGLMRSYLLYEPATVKGLRRALPVLQQIRDEAMTKQSISRVWLDRQIAEILGHAFLRNGDGGRNPTFCASFALLAARHLPHLAMRYVENFGWLPRHMESYPSIGGESADN